MEADMNMREFPASVAAYVADVTDGTLRSYRTPHGFLDPYGEMNGVGYIYSRDEVVRIAVAAALGRTGLGLREAFNVVADANHMIQAAFGGEPDVICKFQKRRHGGAYACLTILRFNASAAVRLANVRIAEAMAASKKTSWIARSA
jgi:hypothetical protein